MRGREWHALRIVFGTPVSHDLTLHVQRYDARAGGGSLDLYRTIDAGLECGLGGGGLDDPCPSPLGWGDGPLGTMSSRVLSFHPDPRG